MREYHLRRRHINLMVSIKDIAESGPAKGPFNDPARFGPSMTMQAKAQSGARKELRGNPITYETESWMEYAIRNSGWGYVVYKTSQAHSDTQWTRFTKRFEADTGNWGHGLENIANIRDQSKMHWVDGSDVGNPNPSLQDLKRHFTTYTESAAFPENCFSDMFLVADDASVASYLTRAPQVSIPGGDVGPFIKAVDALFDPKDAAFRSDESPGFDGTLRVLSSLVWDDMGALLLTQTQGLAELWPLAMEHPLEVYVGPVVEAQTEAWRNLGKTDRQALKKWIKGVRDGDEDEKITRDEL
ncbi:uncharacterized protein PG998_005867 [Apiospora kogelbergensis]|uniref:uncharacterized protein n=1 Tax=Apiospora kogelbergensis TaxID=1337665 RepID=UPI003131D0A3